MKTALKYLLIVLFLSPINGISMEFDGDIELLSKTFFNVNFANLDFTSVNLMGNNLSDVDFSGTNLTGVNLIGTILKNVKMNKQTKFEGARGWSGTLSIEKMANSKIKLVPISGTQILVTKEWLIKQGVIFIDE